MNRREWAGRLEGERQREHCRQRWNLGDKGPEVHLGGGRGRSHRVMAEGCLHTQDKVQGWPEAGIRLQAEPGQLLLPPVGSKAKMIASS